MANRYAAQVCIERPATRSLLSEYVQRVAPPRIGWSDSLHACLSCREPFGHFTEQLILFCATCELHYGAETLHAGLL